tara:strand:+ start:244 stop:486 length:243 start_codon:yes stop_codon:yes gene_type:complete
MLNTGAITKNQNVPKYVPCQLKRIFLKEVMRAENFIDLLIAHGIIKNKIKIIAAPSIGKNVDKILKTTITAKAISLPFSI